MDFLKNLKQVETTKGTDPDSVYVIVAKSKGITLSMKPIAWIKEKNNHVYFGVRVRADIPDTKAISDTFGLKGLKGKGTTHSSGVFFTEIAPEAIAGTNVIQIIKNNHLIEALSYRVLEQITLKKPEYISKPEPLIEFLYYALETIIKDNSEEYPQKFQWHWDN